MMNAECGVGDAGVESRGASAQKGGGISGEARMGAVPGLPS